ncbi:NUDIX hydrolase [Microbacterium gorillae]|uniref:NUDIX hydrolase n=1 Tax=Microbacterium gorillae TaxID=1231063 RepID=UPI00058DB0CE|nr:CoA pyrophosphatase [Microbacterium gorillae]
MTQRQQDAFAELVAAASGGLDTHGYPLRPDTSADRVSAVLVLFGAVDDTHVGSSRGLAPSDLDVVLEVRASALRAHPGEVAFPGGRRDPEDVDLVATALREAREEIALDSDAVDIAATLQDLPLAASANRVTPVLAWRTRDVTLVAVDQAETASVHRVPVRRLLDPATRFTTVLRRPVGEFRGPGWQIDDLFIWGFTALILNGLFDAAGWTIPWDVDNAVQL